MTRPGDELAPRVEQLLDRPRHLVERGAHLAQLARAAAGHAGGEVARGELRRGRAEPIQRAEDPAPEQQRATGGRERRCGRDCEDLDVVVHVEHHPARRQHRGEREHDGEQRERHELEPQTREQAEGERPGDAGRERREREDDSDGRHGLNR